jgi:cytolysin-activating lysine-acyltransferase
MESGVKSNGALKNGKADTGAPVMSNATILGEIVWLLSYSNLHQDWPIGSIQQWVLPALLHNQFRIYRRSGKPRGFVSWAWMSKDVEEAFVLNTSSLRPGDWKSGNRGWIIDFVAPFGDAKAIAHDLKYNIFPNDVGRYLRIKKGSDTIQIRYLHGANAVAKSKDPKYNPTVELPQNH